MRTNEKILFVLLASAALSINVVSVFSTGFYQDDFAFITATPKALASFEGYLKYSISFGITRFLTCTLFLLTLYTRWAVHHPWIAHSYLFLSNLSVAVALWFLLRMSGISKRTSAWCALFFYSLAVKNITDHYVGCTMYSFSALLMLISLLFAGRQVHSGFKKKSYWLMSSLFFLSSLFMLEQWYLAGILYPLWVYLLFGDSFSFRRDWKKYVPFFFHSLCALAMTAYILLRPEKGYQTPCLGSALIQQSARGSVEILSAYYSILFTEPRAFLHSLFYGQPFFAYHYVRHEWMIIIIPASMVLILSLIESRPNQNLTLSNPRRSALRMFKYIFLGITLAALTYMTVLSKYGGGSTSPFGRGHYIPTVGIALALAGFLDFAAERRSRTLLSIMVLFILFSAMANMRSLAMWSRAWQIQTVIVDSLKTHISSSEKVRLIYLKNPPNMIGPAYVCASHWGFPNLVRLRLGKEDLSVVYLGNPVDPAKLKELLEKSSEKSIRGFDYQEDAQRKITLKPLTLSETLSELS